MTVKAIPEGYSSITPYLLLHDVRGFLDFVKNAFDAETAFVFESSDGGIKHAQLKIGNAMMMVGEAPSTNDIMPAPLYLYVEDCDATYDQAMAAGAETIMPCEDMFYGDRHGGVMDPFGNIWWIATHIEDVDEAELQKRAAQFEADQQQ